jgi:molybdopterin-containing oxidoreductase family iron-sulfur binding subunit
LVLNPDVTVRAKGVIEKCSFCVQRIQEKKLEAKTENRQLRDGDVVPACAQACPSEAIVFGNLNDKDSKIARYYKDERNYHLLEELHTLPSVGYLTKVKNTTV